MDDIVSLLGAHYTLFEDWGGLFVVGLSACVAGAIWAAWRARGWRRLASTAAVIPPMLGLAVCAFALPRLHAPVVPDDYRIEPVAVPGPAGLLGGEVLAPATRGTHPALVFIVGSDISSYRSNYSAMVNDLITPAAAAHRFVIAYVDKRGVGRSTGQWVSASIEDRADDARAVVAWLRRRSDVDPRRIVVVGHSQGGWVAQRLASDASPPALVVSLAGPAVGVEEQILDDEAGGLECDGVSPARAREQAGALIAQLQVESAGATGGRLRQFATIHRYRPDAVLRALSTATLFIFGDNDRLVPAESNVARLNQLWGGTTPALATVVRIPGAVHSMRLADRCGDSGRAGGIAPEVRQVLAEALRAVAAE